MNAIGNLLRKASRIIPTEEIRWRRFVSSEVNSIGNTIPVYTKWESIKANVQPGLTFSFNARGVASSTEIAKQLGIDLTKEIITVYVANLNITNVHGQTMPDQVSYNGKIYNIWSVSNWYEYDGWKSLICVEDTRER